MNMDGRKYLGDFYITREKIHFEGKNGLKREIKLDSIDKIEITGRVFKKLNVIYGEEKYIFNIKNTANIRHLIESLMK
ncbi:MAG: hypothetical protein J7K61_04140 [Thermoplasmata archaeon]|nr:hypothetical protein [Thermoplasmata archaeon]